MLLRVFVADLVVVVVAAATAGLQLIWWYQYINIHACILIVEMSYKQNVFS